MSKRYFELTDDMSIPARWLLGDTADAQGNEVGRLLFMSEKPPAFDGTLRVPIYHPGTPLDFSFADDGDFPVVTGKVASVLAALAPVDVQLFPVQVDSQSESYFLVNVARVVKCIDDETSAEVRYWTPEDERPDKVGQYRAVYGMRIDPSKVGDVKVFRPWGYVGTIIIAEELKEALERTGATGLKFEEVTGPSPISAEERAYKRKCRELLEPPDKARRAAWRTLGILDKRGTTPGGICYSWPGYRQTWHAIHREAGRTLLVSDGLSDPFIARMEASVGFGLELALEVEEPLGSNIGESWAFQLLKRVTNEVVAHEQVREHLNAGTVSLEVSGKGLPKPLVTREGRVAVLLGIESRMLPGHFPTPFGDVRLVTIKALLPGEQEYLLKHGAEGHAELARRFAASTEAHLSLLQRRAVV